MVKIGWRFREIAIPSHLTGKPYRQLSGFPDFITDCLHPSTVIVNFPNVFQPEQTWTRLTF